MLTDACSGRGMPIREAAKGVAGALLFLIHAAFVIASLAGPLLILLGTFKVDGRLTLEAWQAVAGDTDRWVGLLRNSLQVVAWAVAVCLPAGLILAFALFKVNLHGRAAMVALTLLTAAVPLYVVAGAALSFANKEQWLESRAAVGLVHAAAHLPAVVLILGVAFRAINADLEEAALLEGAGPTTLLRLSARLAAGGIITVLIILLLWVTADYSVSDIFMVRTFAEEVYTQYALHARPQEPSLVCVPQILLFGGVLWIFRRGLLCGDQPWESAGRTLIYRVRWRSPVTLAVAGLLAGYTILLVFFMLRRFGPGDHLDRYFVMFASEIQASVVTSLAAGLLSAALAVGLAWYLVRWTNWRSCLIAYVILMLAFPAPLIGMGIIRVFNRDGFAGVIYDSPIILVLGWCFRFVPVAVLLLVPSIRAIPHECEQAAQVDGCSRLDLWARIIFPQCLPSALLAVFLVTLLSLGELPCSVLVAPPGYVTIGVRFFSLIHYGLYGDAAALCILSMLIVIAPAICVLLLLRRRLLG